MRAVSVCDVNAAVSIGNGWVRCRGKVQIAGVELLAGIELLARTPEAGSYGSRHNLEMAAGWFRVCDVNAAVSLENASIRGSPHHHMSEGWEGF